LISPGASEDSVRRKVKMDEKFSIDEMTVVGISLTVEEGA